MEDCEGGWKACVRDEDCDVIGVPEACGVLFTGFNPQLRQCQPAQAIADVECGSTNQITTDDGRVIDAGTSVRASCSNGLCLSAAESFKCGSNTCLSSETCVRLYTYDQDVVDVASTCLEADCPLGPHCSCLGTFCDELGYSCVDQGPQEAPDAYCRRSR